jgi:hypothetical protein
LFSPPKALWISGKANSRRVKREAVQAKNSVGSGARRKRTSPPPSTMRRGIGDRSLKSQRFEVITPTLRRARDRPAEMPL